MPRRVWLRHNGRARELVARGELPPREVSLD